MRGGDPNRLSPTDSKRLGNGIMAVLLIPFTLTIVALGAMFKLLYHIYKAMFVGAYKGIKLLINKRKED